MRRLKVVFGMCVLVLLSSALSGCIVVPFPRGHGGYYHDHDRH